MTLPCDTCTTPDKCVNKCRLFWEQVESRKTLPPMFFEAPQTVVITKQERDDLRRFNADMRKLLGEFIAMAASTPIEMARFFETCTTAHRLLIDKCSLGSSEMDTTHMLYVALARMVREHDSLTRSREKTDQPPALTNECIYLAKSALEKHEIELAKWPGRPQ